MQKKILLVAATVFEIQPTLDWLAQKHQHMNPDMPFDPYLSRQFTLQNQTTVHILVTGIGIANTAFQLGKRLALHEYDLVCNVGVAGAFVQTDSHKTLILGEVVEVTEERYADLGAEDADGSFLDFFGTDLMAADDFPFEQKGKLVNPKPLHLENIPQVSGLTVQTVHGYAPSITALQARYPDVQVETMEGAAFFEACRRSQVAQFTQLRAISNFVESRNRANWQMKKAIEHLNSVLKGIMSYEL